jgi:hypothetical protein
MIVLPPDTEELSEVDLAIREIFQMEVNERRIIPRDPIPQEKKIIKAVDAIAPLPVVHTPDSVKQKLKTDHWDFHVSQEYYDPRCSLCVADPKFKKPTRSQVQPSEEPTEVVMPLREISGQLRQQQEEALRQEASRPPSFAQLWQKQIEEETPRSPITPRRPRSQELSRGVTGSGRLRSNSKSGVKGVHLHNPRKGIWRATIKKDGKPFIIGYFEDKFDAARAYDAEAVLMYGDRAVTNQSMGLIPRAPQQPEVQHPEVQPTVQQSEAQHPRAQGLRRDSTSGCKGCCWYPSMGKWRVTISKDRKPLHLGYFTDLLEAAKAYDKAAKELFGDDAELNFPSGLIPVTPQST